MQYSLRFLVLGLSATLAAGASLNKRETCNADNVLRALRSADGAASTFCSTYTQTTATSGQPYPTYISAYSTAPARVSSACTCLNNPPTPTCNVGNQNVIANSGFDKLDTTKPRNAQATPWVVTQETNAVVQYGPVTAAQTPPNAAELYFSASTGVVAFSQTVLVCNGALYQFGLSFRQQGDASKNGGCTITLSGDYFNQDIELGFSGFVSNTTAFPGGGGFVRVNGGPVNARGQVSSTITVKASCHDAPTAQLDAVYLRPSQ